MTEGYVVRYRDLDGGEADSPPFPSLAAAIRQGRLLEVHHCTILTVVGPVGEVTWDEVDALAEVMLKPPIR
jgi:hypothetical protein